MAVKLSRTSYYDYFKGRAHGLTTRAIRDGILIPQPCEKCGNPKTVAHHETYLEPLEVNWLCRRCHQSHHAAMTWRTKWLRKLAKDLMHIIVHDFSSHEREAEPVQIAIDCLYKVSEVCGISKFDKDILIQKARNELAKVIELPAHYFEIPSINDVIERRV